MKLMKNKFVLFALVAGMTCAPLASMVYTPQQLRKMAKIRQLKKEIKNREDQIRKLQESMEPKDKRGLPKELLPVWQR